MVMRLRSTIVRWPTKAPRENPRFMLDLWPPKLNGAGLFLIAAKNRELLKRATTPKISTMEKYVLPNPTIGQKILEQAKETSERVAALTALLDPPDAALDPVADLATALTEIAAAIRSQTQSIEQLRSEVHDLAMALQQD
jgi:hypothetical protein